MKYHVKKSQTCAIYNVLSDSTPEPMHGRFFRITP